MRIPFDSLTLAAVTAELRAYIGAKVQRIVQAEPLTVSFELYVPGREAILLLSADPQFARAHFVTRFPPSPESPLPLCAVMRARLEGARLLEVTQVGFDRILQLRFGRQDGEHVLIGEFMGKHANLILTEADGRVVGAAKWIGLSKSRRPIQSGAPYRPPPFAPKKSLLEAGPSDQPAECEGASRPLLALLEAKVLDLAQIQRLVADGFVGGHPVLVPECGAYPVSVAALGLKEFPRPSVSIALEQFYALAIPAQRAEAVRNSLAASLGRVALAREAAIADLNEAVQTAGRAGEWQLCGELLLAYAGAIKEGASLYETSDYEGKALTIRLNPELSAIENASAYFDRAKKSKSRAGAVKDQITRLTADLGQLESWLAKIREAESLEQLLELKEQVAAKRWLPKQNPSARREERPYEGHRIREALGPGGITVLYGENAEANDYLTQRVARPNDWWLHIRGGTSAHVVIQTRNQPERVSREALLFAAGLAVQNSPSKHSKFVAVDYTLKKYVRKPRGSARGSVLYTNEKTLHVD